MSYKFRVGISSDFLDGEGKPAFGDIGLGLLDADPLIEYEFFDLGKPEVTPDQVAGYDGIVTLGGRYTAATFAGSQRLTVLARWGVGYDNVDTEACTEANVALVITPDGVRRPVASSIVALILALSHRLIEKTHLSRQGMAAELRKAIGVGLAGKVLGSVGIGNIGRDMFRLAAPFEMTHLAYDPYVTEEQVAGLNIKLVDLDTLLRQSDFLCINCPLTPATRKSIGERELGLLKPSAYLINTARGPIVDTDALLRALRERRLAGAGLDCTDPEPLPVGHELLSMDNVIVTSHKLAWTDAMVLGNGRSDMEAMMSVARGVMPVNVVNKAVFERPQMVAKLERFRRLAQPSGR